MTEVQLIGYAMKKHLAIILLAGVAATADAKCPEFIGTDALGRTFTPYPLDKCGPNTKPQQRPSAARAAPDTGRIYRQSGNNTVVDTQTRQVFAGSNSNNYPAPVANNRSNNGGAPIGNTWTPPVDNRIPAITGNGTVLVPAGAGYVNTRDGNYLPQVAPNAVINPQTGQIIPVP